MKQKLIYVVSIIVSLFVGASIMYLLIVFVPLKTIKENTIVNVTKIEEQATIEAIKKVEDAVVVVESYNKNAASGTGTGFIYKKEGNKGYIITNSHVIDDATRVEVIFTNNERAEAKVLGKDAYADIAILSVDEKNVTSVATLGKSENMLIGNTVFTVGSPLGSDYSGSVTKGIISGKDRLVSVSISGNSYDWMVKAIQTDAAINPGNSGSPLVNLSGEVIGVTSLKLVDDNVEGMGFAIPIEDVVEYAKQLEKGKTIQRPYIGVSLLSASDYYSLFVAGLSVNRDVTKGAVLAKVLEDSTAAKAGLKKGDIITKINNNEITNVATFRYYLYSYKVGDTIKLTYIRNGKQATMNVKLELQSE